MSFKVYFFIVLYVFSSFLLSEKANLVSIETDSSNGVGVYVSLDSSNYIITAAHNIHAKDFVGIDTVEHGLIALSNQFDPKNFLYDFDFDIAVYKCCQEDETILSAKGYKAWSLPTPNKNKNSKALVRVDVWFPKPKTNDDKMQTYRLGNLEDLKTFFPVSDSSFIDKRFSSNKFLVLMNKNSLIIPGFSGTSITEDNNRILGIIQGGVCDIAWGIPIERIQITIRKLSKKKIKNNPSKIFLNSEIYLSDHLIRMGKVKALKKLEKMKTTYILTDKPFQQGIRNGVMLARLYKKDFPDNYEKDDLQSYLYGFLEGLKHGLKNYLTYSDQEDVDKHLFGFTIGFLRTFKI